MGFLSKILGLIIPSVLSWIYDKVFGGISQWLADRKARAEIEAKNKAAREALEAAKTPKEIDDAADQIRRNW